MDIFENNISDICAFWIDRDERTGNYYHSSVDSIVVNPQERTLRVELRGNDEVFQVVFKKEDSGWFYKSDAYDDENEWFSMDYFVGNGEVVFVRSDNYEQIYFHVVFE